MENLPLLGRLFDNTPSAAPGMGSVPNDVAAIDLARAKLAAELSADPQAAASRYAALVANFDAQRQSAAQAIFGLGEAYRRMKRFTEARVQYARILREFVDFPELAKLSQKQLGSTTSFTGDDDPRGEQPLATPIAPGIATSPAVWREQRELVMEELQLLNEELARTKSRIEAGVEPKSSTLPLQREILRLKQELLRIPNDDARATPTQKAPSPAPADPSHEHEHEAPAPAR
jgi:hypothetical protein